MRDLQEKKRMRDLLRSPVLSVILLILVLLLLKSNYNIYKKNQIAKMSRDESDKRLASLREQSDRLGAELERLNTERGIEEELRNKFQITKGGEEVLVVVDEPPESSADTTSEDEKKGLWQSITAFFGF